MSDPFPEILQNIGSLLKSAEWVERFMQDQGDTNKQMADLHRTITKRVEQEAVKLARVEERINSAGRLIKILASTGFGGALLSALGYKFVT